MIVFRTAGEVTDWYVAFHTTSASRLVARLVPGTFKHVTAFGFSDECKAWVFIDTSLACTRVMLLPDSQASLAKLRSWGVRVMDPDEGAHACGEGGPGRLPDPERIASEVIKALAQG